MTRLLTAALTLTVMGLPAKAEEVKPEAQAAISKALAAIGCTVEAGDVDATDDGYEADDVLQRWRVRGDLRQGLQDQVQREGRILSLWLLGLPRTQVVDRGALAFYGPPDLTSG
jgi:hypothetical protein